MPTLSPPVTSIVSFGGTPVYAIYGPLLSGLIANPPTFQDQGLTGAPEPLFIDLVKPAGLSASGTTIILQPGESYAIPAGDTNGVSINAATSGHRFSAMFVLSDVIVVVPGGGIGPQPVPPSGNPIPAATTTVTVGGTPVIAMFAPVLGGIIENPPTAEDQGLVDSGVENLFIDLTGPAALMETATTLPLYPGQVYTIPSGTTKNVSVNAATSGHRFSAIIIRQTTPFPPTPVPTPFPPAGPTALTKTIPSYLYQQYQDDDNLQAFVAAYNTMAQQYVAWFTSINLPVYTGAQISGDLLDWVAEGLYGIVRPTISSGVEQTIGPFNTYTLDTVAFNDEVNVGPQGTIAVTDDLFKRIITWHYFKGDGKVISVLWLKRRVSRLLDGVNGTNPPIDNTYNIGIAIAGHVVTITLFSPPAGMVNLLRSAILSGALELPFQLTYTVVSG